MSYVAHLEVGVPVAAPAERVWSELVAWERQGAWMIGTDVRRVDAETRAGTDGSSTGSAGADSAGTDRTGIDVAGTDGVGTELVARTALGPVGFTDAMVITAWEPPTRCEVLHHGTVLRGDGGFVVRAEASGRSTLTWWERIAVPGPAPIVGAGWRLARPPVHALLRRCLRRFAQLVEESSR